MFSREQRACLCCLSQQQAGAFGHLGERGRGQSQQCVVGPARTGLAGGKIWEPPPGPRSEAAVLWWWRACSDRNGGPDGGHRMVRIEGPPR